MSISCHSGNCIIKTNQKQKRKKSFKMKKNGLKTKFIALAMATITTLSAGSMFSVSAAEAPKHTPPTLATQAIQTKTDKKNQH